MKKIYVVRRGKVVEKGSKEDWEEESLESKEEEMNVREKCLTEFKEALRYQDKPRWYKSISLFGGCPSIVQYKPKKGFGRFKLEEFEKSSDCLSNPDLKSLLILLRKYPSGEESVYDKIETVIFKGFFKFLEKAARSGEKILLSDGFEGIVERGRDCFAQLEYRLIQTGDETKINTNNSSVLTYGYNGYGQMASEFRIPDRRFDW